MDNWYANNFNTPLKAVDESAFQSWVADKSKTLNRDFIRQLDDYDLRGFWKNGGSDWNGGHMPDTYKKPNHPTFSDESIWNGAQGPMGPYVGGKWIGSDKNGWKFEPSVQMLRTTHNADSLMEYMANNEPGVEIVWPKMD